MIFNSHAGPIRTQMNITQKIPNSQVCYLDEIKQKGINPDESLSYVCYTDKSESKIVIVNTCSSDERESKTVHISINKKEGKYVMNEKINCN